MGSRGRSHQVPLLSALNRKQRLKIYCTPKRDNIHPFVHFQLLIQITGAAVSNVKPKCPSNRLPHPALQWGTPRRFLGIPLGLILVGHQSERLDNRRLEKLLPGVTSLNLCCHIQRIGSQQSVPN